jgi:dipeptidyl aminopeptidase/acylaminoacyl peptidase
MGYGYNDDTRKSRLLYRDNAQQTFRVVDRANDLKREELRDPLAFGSVPGSALVIHKDTLGFSGLYEVDMATGKDLSLVWAAPAGQYIEAVSVGDDGKSVLGIWLRGDRKEVVWRDPVLNEIYTAFASSVPDKRVSIESTSRDRQRMLVTIDRPDSPGALYFFDLANPKLQRIAYMSDRLKDAPLNPVKAITYKSRDGLEIEAILTTPKNSATKKPPVVVMPHGGPWAHDTLDYDYWAQFVASLGYVVIQPNFRGSTGYGKDFERKGEGQLGLAMQDDLNDALKWVGDQGLGDPKRACIVGASYGGYATLWGLARDPALWRCGISIAGVANLRREVNDMGNGNITAGAAEDAWKRMTPDFAAVSPINRVGAITAPLLLVHGKLDVTVPHTQSEAMAAKMKAAGKPVDFVSLPKADHYFTREADRLVLLQSIETFLKKYNPAD